MTPTRTPVCWVPDPGALSLTSLTLAPTRSAVAAAWALTSALAARASAVEASRPQVCSMSFSSSARSLGTGPVPLPGARLCSSRRDQSPTTGRVFQTQVVVSASGVTELGPPRTISLLICASST